MELKSAVTEILVEDPDDPVAKQMRAAIENRETPPTIIKKPVATASQPPKPRPARPATTEPVVTVVTVAAPEENTQPSGTPSEAIPAEPRERNQEDLRAREAELSARLQARRRTLTDGRPSSEAERTRDAARRRYEAMKDRALKLEAEANSSTGQKRINALEQLRPMKGQMMTCQRELETAEEAARAATEKRKAAIENDPEIKSLTEDLAAVRNELKSM